MPADSLVIILAGGVGDLREQRIGADDGVSVADRVAVGVDIAGPESSTFRVADYRRLFRRVRQFGLGITNVVDRPSRAASELSDDELRAGAVALEALVLRHRPRVLAAVRAALAAPA